MPLDSTSDVSDIETATDGEGRQVPVANDGTYTTTIDGAAIDSKGTIFELDTRGKRILDLAINATADASYVLESSPDGTNWFGPWDSWGNESEITQTYRIGSRYVRLKITTEAPDGNSANGFMEVS
ncbi:hypothetical protein [Haloplanus pelagicus]|uniref:hypothetical protein n=1 Tax=Haloplanus pelagicus TaxID=2949995 RepID=UPI0020401A2F|nr:hypothetical protein [Haloplanus sp. HW8-1]